jgi:hypothetical protein
MEKEGRGFLGVFARGGWRDGRELGGEKGAWLVVEIFPLRP